jgi:hypothetical protein
MIGIAQLVFPCPVLRVAAGITNDPAQCLPGDHRLRQLRVQLSPAVMGTAVSVSATFGLRDGPGDWEDDTCTGNPTVLANLEAATAPPLWGNVQIPDAAFI